MTTFAATFVLISFLIFAAHLVFFGFKNKSNHKLVHFLFACLVVNFATHTDTPFDENLSISILVTVQAFLLAWLKYNSIERGRMENTTTGERKIVK